MLYVKTHVKLLMLYPDMFFCYYIFMDTEKRRNSICRMLAAASDPISASSMAEKLSVSRQIIVGDIAILRASGHDIIATPRGYVTGSEHGSEFPYTGVAACRHGRDRLLEELYAIVDLGGTVIDVTVDHAVYGQLCGMLNVASRYDADEFVRILDSEEAQPLYTLTGGIHFHRIGCRSKKIFEAIMKELTDRGIALR
jgi:transcriptional regulator of NAD metabolism